MSVAAKLTRAAVFAGATACATTTATKAPPPPPPVEYPFALPPAPSEGQGTISGVVRESGHRRASVRIVAHNGESQRETITNDKGEYRFLDLPPGAWTVTPEPGYRGHRPQDGMVMQMGVRVDLAANGNVQQDLTVMPPPAYERDTGPCCKPYGAPPARRRIV